MQTRQQERKEARRFIAAEQSSERRSKVREREKALSLRRGKRRHLRKGKTEKQELAFAHVEELRSLRTRRCKARGTDCRSHIVEQDGLVLHATKGWKRLRP